MPDLHDAYALQSAEDNQRLYAQWASDYDESFVAARGYQLHRLVAAGFAAAGGVGPVLDVGAGTGVVGEMLMSLGVSPVDGTDLSPEMLAEAALRDVYDRLFEGDILGTLDAETGSYAGVVSAGTFTLGHVGPAALDEVLRVLKPGGILCLSINAEHYTQAGFEAAFSQRSSLIRDLRLEDVNIYADPKNSPNGKDRAFIVTAFRI